MNLVSQNPLVRLLASYGWAPLLIAVSLALALGGYHALTAAGIAVGLLCGAAGGVVGAGALRAKRIREAFEAKRKADGMLFVCPHCLIADTPTRACPGCRKPLPLEQVLTQGDVVGFCLECRREVSSDALRQAPAACAHCGRSDDGEAWLTQKARVAGTLSFNDFETVAGQVEGATQMDRGIRFVRFEERDQVLFLLCLADLANSRTELPSRHAATCVSSVWVDQFDALAGTEALDRLAQRAGLSQAALKRIQLSVAGKALDAAAERAFSARLGPMRFRVSASSFLARAETASASPLNASTQNAGGPER